ncbi:MAG: AbrB family transcriptional regulator [Paracoccus sp. (in: a-proteobacteria)]|nr:AbrB family transcriptional regulator [Paracoccus sp. (in: a-proteobacteria)]
MPGKLHTAGLGLATLATGLAGGVLFLWLSIPLPWILGSFFATAILAQMGVRFVLPGSWRGYAMVVIGTMLGAGFDQDTVNHVTEWIPSILIMLTLTAIFYWAAFRLLLRFSDMDRQTAFLSAVPGGLSVVSALAENLGGDLRRIALCHTSRLAVLLILTPILIGFISDYDLSTASRVALEHDEPFELLPMSLLALCALGGWALARLLRFSTGMLVFPLLLSAGLHITGVTSAHVPPAFSIIAQLIIGCGIGMRFQGYRLRDILRDGRVSALTGVALALISFGAAWATARLTGQSPAALLLAFLPGGAPELGVVALALDINPAMVAAHSMTRMMMIVLALSFYRP